MKTKHVVKLAMGVLLAGLVSGQADLVESLNNTVTDGTIIIDSGRTDWNGLTGFVTDPDEGSTVDWHQVTIANDSTNYYLRYQMNETTAFDSNFRIFIDTDLDRGTGYIGGQSQFSLGAEYMIEGARLYSFNGGAQTTFSWLDLGMQSYDASVPGDYEVGLAISSLGTQTFNFLLFGTGTVGLDYYEDYYVDSANTGAAGGYLQYTTVPEPGVSVLCGMALGAVLLRRRPRAA